MDEVIIRYIHFLGIFVLFSTLVSEHLLLGRDVSIQQLRIIAQIDKIYGFSALVVLITGLLQWFVVGKPAEFYTSNPLFIIKISVFVLVGLLSIYPTIIFLKNRESKENTIQLPKLFVMITRT